MRKFKQYILVTAGLAILVGALAIVGPEYGYGTPPIVEPVDVNVINTPGVVITNNPTEPVPVAVQKDSRVILHGQVSLIAKGADALDATPILWERPDGTFFNNIPAGYALFITDIIVSWNEDLFIADPDEPFILIFAHMKLDNSTARLMALSGTGLPYSHSFTTPLFFPALNAEGGSMGITRLSGSSTERLLVTLTGYLKPIAS